jgi:hypothetical protein
MLKFCLGIFLAAGAGMAYAVGAAPAITLGQAESYCVTVCYVRVPFTVANYDPARKTGRVFCDLEADVTARLPVYNGEAKTRSVQASSIGVFKNDVGGGKGDVEMSTGIMDKYFIGAKLKSANCHL